MATLRFLLWTAACIGLGIFLATFELGGKTPLVRGQEAWRGAPSAEAMKRTAGDLLGDAKKQLGGREAGPVERHSPEERNAVNALIAKRQQK